MVPDVAAEKVATKVGAAEPQVRKFLPEVQALRALAVLLVVGYHLRPDLLPGGFVGVDVFFVISGYLITGHMLREVRETGRLGLARFWGNRARRILPAGLLVILLVVLTATFVLPITQWRGLGRQALASVFYVQNWVLAADSVDYSASNNAATPFQHFWSLAVEEQFYLLWPFVVVAAAWLAARVRITGPDKIIKDHRRLNLILLVIFGVLVGISFVWGAVQVADHDAAAYFVTTARLWELGVGGILAVVLRYTDQLSWLRSGLALAGLAAIVFASIGFSGSTPFPGPDALLPVLGAAAIIIAGRTSGPGSLTWVVDRRIVQWLGNISYSLYLWHFPIAIYFTTIAHRDPSALEALVLIIVMIAGAAASYYVVEQPVRKSGWARRSDRRALIAAGTAMLIVGVSTSTFWIRPLQTEHQWNQASQQAQKHAGTPDGFGAASARNGSFRAFLGPKKVMAPNPISAKTSDMFLDGVSGRCEPPTSKDRTRSCEFGDPHSRTVIAVVGDSHARMYTPPVLLAAQRHHWRVVTFIHNSCPYSQTARIFPDADNCQAANQDTRRRLAALHPDVVVTSFWAGSRFVDDGRKWHGAGGLAAAWRDLVNDGSRVVVLKDAPQPRANVVTCVAEHYTAPQACNTKRSKGLRSHGLVDAAAKGIAGVQVVDLTDRFCTTKICPAVIGDVLVYIDENHIGKTYAETLMPDIDPALVSAVRQQH